MVQLAPVGHSLPELLHHLDAADVAVDIAAGGVVWEVVDCCMSVQLQPSEQAVVGAPAHPTPAGWANFDAVATAAVSFASFTGGFVPAAVALALAVCYNFIHLLLLFVELLVLLPGRLILWVQRLPLL